MFRNNAIIKITKVFMRALLVVLIAGGLLLSRYVYMQRQTGLKEPEEAMQQEPDSKPEEAMRQKPDLVPEENMRQKLGQEDAVQPEPEPDQEEIVVKKDETDDSYVVDEQAGQEDESAEQDEKPEQPLEEELPAESESAADDEDAQTIQKLFESQEEIITLTMPAEGITDQPFFRSQLCEADAADYDRILEACTQREKVTLGTKRPKVLEELYKFVTYDHPELFYLKNYSYMKHLRNDKITKLEFIPDFQMTEEEQASNQLKIDAYVRTCFAKMPAGLDDYEITKYVYCYVIENTEYVKNSPNNQNICSVFINQQSVCLGYAKAVQYLLGQKGIVSTIVCGRATQQLHGWNLVLLDGQWYHLDATWGDASYNVIEGNQHVYDNMGNEENFDCFLVTDQQIQKNHEILDGFYYPKADSFANNYFRREKLFFVSFNEDRLKEIVARVTESGKKRVTIQACSLELLESMQEELFEKQKIFQIYEDGVTHVGYHVNKDLQTLTFWAVDE